MITGKIIEASAKHNEITERALKKCILKVPVNAVGEIPCLGRFMHPSMIIAITNILRPTNANVEIAERTAICFGIVIAIGKHIEKMKTRSVLFQDFLSITKPNLSKKNIITSDPIIKYAVIEE